MPEKVPTPHDPSSPINTTTPTAHPQQPANDTPGITRGAALALGLVLHNLGTDTATGTDTDTDIPTSVGDWLGAFLGSYAFGSIIFGLVNIAWHREREELGRVAPEERGRRWHCLGWFLMGWMWPLAVVYASWLVVRQWWEERREGGMEMERGVEMSPRGDGSVGGMGDVERGLGEGERAGLWAGVGRRLLFWRSEGRRKEGGAERNQGQVLEVPMPSKNVDSDGSSV